MPKIVRVKAYFLFCDIKAYILSKGGFIPELRRFSLHVEDADDDGNALYEQLVQKIHTTFGTELMPMGQPFRLYWKDVDYEYVAFYSSKELLEAIDVMKPSQTVVTATTIISKYVWNYRGDDRFMLLDSLKIYVCVPDNVATEMTNECRRVTQAPPPRVPPTHSLTLLPVTLATLSVTRPTAATSQATTTSNNSVPAVTALPMPASQRKTEASQHSITPAASAFAASSSDETSSDDYDMVKLEKEMAKCL